MMRRLFSRLRRRFHVLCRKEAPPEPPQHTPEAPQRTPEQPERTLKPPQHTPEPPERTLEPPERTLEPPERTPAQPERTAEPPQRTPEPPQRTAEPPERTAEPPERTPAEPGCTAAAGEAAAAPFRTVSAACETVRRAIKALCPPVAKLKDAERQRLGGLIFYGAVHFVFQVSDLLRERPQLSPEPARIHAAGLRGRQCRAIGWSIVHGVLAELTELANDCYLHEQGTALEEAQQVLASFDLELEHASLKGRPDAQLIEDALRVARTRVVLQRGELRQRQAQRRADKKLREARARAGVREVGTGRKAAGKRRRGEPAGPVLSLEAWGRKHQRG